MKVEEWANVYSDGSIMCTHYSEEQAKRCQAFTGNNIVHLVGEYKLPKRRVKKKGWIWVKKGHDNDYLNASFIYLTKDRAERAEYANHYTLMEIEFECEE